MSDGVHPRDVIPHCCECGERVRTTQLGISIEVVGFVEYRGAVGGAHAIVDRRETGRYRCVPCTTARRLGMTTGSPQAEQTRLL